MRIPDYVLCIYPVTHFFSRYHGNIRRALVNARRRRIRIRGIWSTRRVNHREFWHGRLFTVRSGVLALRSRDSSLFRRTHRQMHAVSLHSRMLPFGITTPFPLSERICLLLPPFSPFSPLVAESGGRSSPSLFSQERIINLIHLCLSCTFRTRGCVIHGKPCWADLVRFSNY